MNILKNLFLFIIFCCAVGLFIIQQNPQLKNKLVQMVIPEYGAKKAEPKKIPPIANEEQKIRDEQRKSILVKELLGEIDQLKITQDYISKLEQNYKNKEIIAVFKEQEIAISRNIRMLKRELKIKDLSELHPTVVTP